MSCRLSRNNSKTKNSSNAGKGSNNTNNNSFNYSLNHSSDKIINTPKRDTTMVSKCKSVDKLSKVSRKGSISTLDPNETSVNHYLQRRHTEAQEKLMKLKLEKQKKEILELRDRPKISENSKRIVERITNGVNVYDRLTNKNNQRRKDEEIRRLETLTKPVSKPCINETSEKLQRTIDDLYEWQRKLDEKKTNLSNNQNKRVCQRPQILRQSEDMLREKMPDYLYTKVEDRLLERGRILRYKLEEAKEISLERVTSPRIDRTPSRTKMRGTTRPSSSKLNTSTQTPSKPTKQTLSKNKERSTSRSKPLTNCNKSVKSSNSNRGTNVKSINETTNKSITMTCPNLDKSEHIRKSLNEYYKLKSKESTKTAFRRNMTTHEENIFKPADNPCQVDNSSEVDKPSEFGKNELSDINSWVNTHAEEDQYAIGRVNKIRQISADQDQDKAEVTSELPRYNFNTDILNKFKDDDFSSFKRESKIISKEITGVTNQRQRDLAGMQSLLNSIENKQNFVYEKKKFTQYKTTESSDVNSNIDNEREQHKMRSEVNQRLKTQILENDLISYNNQIDYLNERLKLNEVSKKYLSDKINEFSAIKKDQIEHDSKMSNPPYNKYKNNHEVIRQPNNLDSFESFTRKK